MSFIETYLFCALGVLISILLPILRNSLPVNTETREAGRSAVLEHIWIVAKPYIMVGLFSLVAALLVVAALKNSLTDWGTALLAGYAWDSTVQKLKG
jgi:hypothetical protein